MTNNNPQTPPATQGRELTTALILISCVAIVGTWEYLTNRDGPDPGLLLSAAHFTDFTPPTGNRLVERRDITPTPNEPNILAYQYGPPPTRQTTTNQPPDTAPVAVRLVHGYNMPDCMRIKGYNVELIADRRHPSPDAPDSTPPVQIWRITSETEDPSVWVTSMLDAGDFHATDTDVRAMRFPKIGIPDDPQWTPRGVTLASLRHPLSEFRKFLRAKWNASRCDPMTFLRLKRPAWTSDEMLTLVSASESPAPDCAPQTTEAVLQIHTAMYRALKEWRATRLPQTP